MWRVLFSSEYYSSCLEQICSYFSIISLDGLGRFSRGEVIAAGVLLSYLKLTQCGKIPILKMIQNESENNFLEIDYFTQKSLEILSNLSGETNVSEKGIGILLPIFSIVCLVLANKAIKKDEDLVKSVDRLR